MKTFEFTVVATGLDPEADNFEDRFFEAGCDDATISFQKGVIILEFARGAATFSSALISAVTDVRKAGARIERFEPDHLVSLSEIARRANLTRGAASNYHLGLRGENFPPPVARVTSDNPLWDWCEVANWLLKRQQLSKEAALQARLFREANVMTGHFKQEVFDNFVRRLEAAESEFKDLEDAADTASAN